MRILMLYPSSTPRENSAFEWFKEIGNKYNVEVEIDFFENLSLPLLSSEAATLPDVVIMRGYEFELSRYFEEQGVRVINSSEAMALSRNKYATQKVMEQQGIRVPKTLFDEVRTYQEICDELGSPFVVKELTGSKGENVFLVNNSDELSEVVRCCGGQENFFEKVLLQEFVAFSSGRDVRVWVLGGEVLCSVLRHNQHSFKSNFAQGGTASAFELSQEGKEMAIRATEALGLDFAGVDLLFSGDDLSEFILCEVNGNAGFRTAAFVDSSTTIPEMLIRFATSQS